MAALRDILDKHGTALVIDAASTRIQAGWLAREAEAVWRSSETEAGIGVFENVAALGHAIDAAGAFVFCEGPGSILGIRSVAMALRTWQVIRPRPAYAYCGLELVARALDDPGLAVIADARRGLWHCFQLGGELRRVSTGELPDALAMPDGFRHWSPLPPGVRRVPYDIPTLLAQAGDADAFRLVDAPDAFLHEEPSYVTWTPQVHRAPAPS